MRLVKLIITNILTKTLNALRGRVSRYHAQAQVLCERIEVTVAVE